MKAKPLLVAVPAAIALAIIALFFLRPREPQYKGVPLSTWLSRHAAPAPNPQRQEAEQAIKSIGTNALPLLQEWIVCDRPKWRVNAFHYYPRIFKAIPWLYRPTERETRADNATYAFAALGTNAASAVPTLTALTKNTNRPWSRVRALYALCGIGDPSLPYFREALRANDPQVMGLYRFVTSTPAPDLSAYPQEYRAYFTKAMSTLALLAPDPSTNAPAQ